VIVFLAGGRRGKRQEGIKKKILMENMRVELVEIIMIYLHRACIEKLFMAFLR
jgi:hypothetical protein